MRRRPFRRWAALLPALLCAAALLPTRAEANMDIRIGVKCKCPPYQFLDETGAPSGLHIQIMDRIAQSQHLTVTYVVCQTNSDAAQALGRGEIDAILGAQYTARPDADTLCTRAISAGSVALATTTANAERVTDKTSGSVRFTLAFELGTIDFSQVAQLNTNLTVVAGDQTQLFRQLTSGEVDAVAAVTESLLYQRRTADTADDIQLMNSYMGRVQYAILVRRGDLMLFNRLEQGLSQLRNTDDYEQIVKSWITDENLELAERRNEKLLGAIVMLLFFAAGVFLFFHVWNRHLKRMVHRQTEEIRIQMNRLEEAGTLQKLLIENFPNSIVILKQDGTVLLMNPRAEHAAQREPAPWDDPDRPPVNIAQLRLFSQIWEATQSQTGGMVSSAILPLVTPDRRELQFRYQYYRLNQQGDNALFAEDVTQEELRRNEIFEANKNRTLNRLIAGIAHEIKNPLMALQAFASAMREQGGDPDFQQSFARYVPREVERINRLVEALTNYAKPPRSVRERVEVREIIRECEYLVSAAAGKKKVSFVCRAEDALYIRVDRDQIKQALLNLMINSMESLEERSRKEPEGRFTATVSAGREGDFVRISVRDEGVGMSEESMRNCIEPFYTTKKTGTGMGLSLAKQFVSENGGAFRIASELNRYTEITMLFKEEAAT